MPLITVFASFSSVHAWNACLPHIPTDFAATCLVSLGWSFRKNINDPSSTHLLHSLDALWHLSWYFYKCSFPNSVKILLKFLLKPNRSWEIVIREAHRIFWFQFPDASWGWSYTVDSWDAMVGGTSGRIVRPGFKVLLTGNILISWLVSADSLVGCCCRVRAIARLLEVFYIGGGIRDVSRYTWVKSRS